MFNFVKSKIRGKKTITVIFLALMLTGLFLSSTSPALAAGQACYAASSDGSGGPLNRPACPESEQCIRADFFTNAGTCQPRPPQPSICDANLVGKPFCFIAKWPVVLIGSITIGLDLITRSLLNGILNFLITDISYTKTSIVSIGWPIVRDFANILVVLGFVGVALATILRFKDYEAKALLGKLIVAALLINFSLVICAVIIDISNITIKFFVMGTPTSTTDEIMRNINRLWAQLIDTSVSPLNMTMAVISQIIGAILSGLTRGLFVFLFLFRIIAIWILVILSPLAFICSVFPITRSYYETWKTNFIQWCIIGISGSFFLYLADKLQNTTTPLSAITPLSSQGQSASVLINSFNTVFTALIPALFLLVGFFASLQTSAMGASYAISGFNKAKGYAGAGAKFVGGRAAKKLGVDTIGQDFKTGMLGLAEKVPMIGAKQGSANAMRQEQFKERMKPYTELAGAEANSDILAQRAMNSRIPEERAAYVAELNKRKKLAAIQVKDSTGKIDDDKTAKARERATKDAAAHGIDTSKYGEAHFEFAAFDNKKVEDTMKKRSMSRPDAEDFVVREQLAENLPSMSDSQRQAVNKKYLDKDFLIENFNPNIAKSYKAAKKSLRTRIRNARAEIKTRILDVKSGGPDDDPAEFNRLQNLLKAINKIPA